jgi:hypothetical protein
MRPYSSIVAQIVLFVNHNNIVIMVAGGRRLKKESKTFFLLGFYARTILMALEG